MGNHLSSHSRAARGRMVGATHWRSSPRSVGFTPSVSFSYKLAKSSEGSWARESLSRGPGCTSLYRPRCLSPLAVKGAVMGLFNKRKSQEDLDAALLSAAKDGDVTAIQEALDQGAAIEAKDDHGGTALSAAALNGRTDAIELLLSKKANIEAKNKYGYTPLAIATRTDHVVAVELLLSKGAAIEARTNKGFSPLAIAAYYGQIDALQVLLAQGADANAKTKDGGTPLVLAAVNAHVAAIQLLIAASGVEPVLI